MVNDGYGYDSASRDEAAAMLAGATWIAFPEAIPPAAGERPAYAFRTSFVLEALPRTAAIHATAHGIYEVFVNGVRVGDEELAPGFTSYQATLHVQTLPIADLLQVGSNDVRIVLSDGWYRGRHGYNRVADSYGTRTSVIARIDLDGRNIPTDSSWTVSTTEIVAADLMDGQIVDMRLIDREAWVDCVVSDDPLTQLDGRFARNPAPPVRRTSTHAPTSVTRLPSGRQIVDFGIMLNGWVRLESLGAEGTTSTLLHGEALGADGDLDMQHLAAIQWPAETRLPTGQIDRVTSRGAAGDVFEPRHTTHGFRYVAIDGRADDVAADDILGIEVRSDLATTGRFSSSNDDLNRLHEIAVQTWRANSCDVPTDCPTRERFGYTGDYQIYAHTAAFIDDVDGFSRKWLRSLADDQKPSGCITNVAPNAGGVPDPMFVADGAAGWGMPRPSCRGSSISHTATRGCWPRTSP
ncbi:family 78 glycoside hydrolase catalytic domain [Agromyces mangrovi Wang et al. 2018]|uniref:family 78 glycoside hydrolase catalytic domain n=1 Tax=Agromyces mangrovi TaxID=1858653 RepID=UPI002572FA1A|nr:family 78 glycoside hydrolase catalytic domain [Agromyces mangrovi]BDZ65069.1 hypothetical protein GCM10025877_20070 [Agromyces mangrovi]